jgi:3-hydroxyacyl-[acyl-carrier protein] dehydratase/trans-2-decenoyl-[acyl-carrier protein] isomerase
LNYSKEELIECGNGNLFTKDGDGRLPSDEMLMFDEIININDFGGEFEKGTVVANLKINPELWFLDCHFKEDPVMPGCLGLDAMWQLVGFFLGWIGEPGRGRALGAGSIKFAGEILQDTKKVAYIISMKKVIKRGVVVGVGNGIVKADGKTIYHAEGLKVGLIK